MIQDIELKDKNANVFQVLERALGMDTVLGSNAMMVHALMLMTYVMADLIAVNQKMKRYVSNTCRKIQSDSLYETSTM